MTERARCGGGCEGAVAVESSGDFGILRPHHFCTQCQSYMHLKVFPTSTAGRDQEPLTIHSRKKYSTQTQDIPLQFPAPPLDVLQQHQYLGSRPTTVHKHKNIPTPFNVLRQCMAEDLLEDEAKGIKESVPLN